ncbi:MAG: SRPBCC family protein [Planctomycetes bacterium]|nr:SRPBCC family protein [Planctomycetota bacterium]
MTEHLLQTTLWLPRRPEEVFPFFSDALNLEAITPPWLHFKVLTPAPIQMAKGTLIDYKLRLRGMPIRWRTLISAWEPPFMFVDEQLKGPYNKWHHTHTFEAKDGGTLCTDKVVYAAPGGRPVHSLFVRPQIEKIFEYRQEQLLKLLGAGRLSAQAAA